MKKEKQKVILCGTVHIDLNGAERLKKVLKKEKPNVITIEYAKEHLEGHKKLQNFINKNKLLLKHGTRRIKLTPFNQSQIVKMNREILAKFFSEIEFELRVAKEYAIKNNVKLICVEKKELVDEVAKEIDKDVKKGTVRWFSKIPWEAFKLSLENFNEFVDNFYKPRKVPKIHDLTKLVERNKFAVKEILKLKEKKILHIGGCAHIFENHPNMFEMLKEKGMKVKRLKIIDFDKEFIRK